jgi:hypothetical protein
MIGIRRIRKRIAIAETQPEKPKSIRQGVRKYCTPGSTEAKRPEKADIEGRYPMMKEANAWTTKKIMKSIPHLSVTDFMTKPSIELSPDKKMPNILDDPPAMIIFLSVKQ